jgi:hypothetical protein
MGDQCVNIAKLVPLSGYEAPKDKDIFDAIERSERRRALAPGRRLELAPPHVGCCWC